MAMCSDEPPPVVEFEFLAMEAVLSTVISDYRDKAVALLDEVHRHLKRINSSTALKTSHQVSLLLATKGTTPYSWARV